MGSEMCIRDRVLEQVLCEGPFEIHYILFRSIPKCSCLLSTKVADSLIAFNKKERESTNTTTILNERDIVGLQYLAGYVLHKLYRKHAKANTKESQQAKAILKAGKLEESTHGASIQKLITSLNRGGLWSVTMPAQRIFVKIEKHCRLLTPNINLELRNKS